MGLGENEGLALFPKVSGHVCTFPSAWFLRMLDLESFVSGRQNDLRSNRFGNLRMHSRALSVSFTEKSK